MLTSVVHNNKGKFSTKFRVASRHYLRSNRGHWRTKLFLQVSLNYQKYKPSCFQTNKVTIRQDVKAEIVRNANFCSNNKGKFSTNFRVASGHCLRSNRGHWRMDLFYKVLVTQCTILKLFRDIDSIKISF